MTRGRPAINIFSHTAQEGETLNEFSMGRGADVLRDFRSLLKSTPYTLTP